jgi:hypothetical protein
VPGHSGEDQFSILLPVLKDYNIVQKFGAVIADNASPNNVLCWTIENHLDMEYKIKWKADHWCIHCIGHIINLAVQAFLFANVIEMVELELYDEQDRAGQLIDVEERKIKFRLMGPLGQAHNIVIHIRGSAGRTEEFRALTGRMIPLDNRTRWNSWYEMLIVLLDKQEQVEKYV